MSAQEFFDEDYYDENSFSFEGINYCPCPSLPGRDLQDINATDINTSDEDNEDDSALLWELIVTCLVILFMFGALLADLAGADSIMLAAVTIFMVTQIISVSEGLAGFSNEGLLTVLVLFVVAEGISRTGALDWYMGKLLGRPRSVGSAQVRLMVPIAIVSAFLNNTPVVAVMIPIVQRWGKNIGVNPQQLLIPLSYASIFGGTCTLIGTSTNLIVNGLLEDRYAGTPNYSSIGLFDLGEFGVPVAILGMTYILLVSSFFLPGAQKGGGGSSPLEDNEDVLLGARLTQWSPAAGRSVKRSGLRDTGGIYLVSVHRFATGNVHRAVGQDFVLNAGDILYFTGLVEGFGAFCEEHGLEMITNEIQDTMHGDKLNQEGKDREVVEYNAEPKPPMIEEELTGDSDEEKEADRVEAPIFVTTQLSTVQEDSVVPLDVPIEVGTTKESLIMSDNYERLRIINRLTDMIRDMDREEAKAVGPASLRRTQSTRMNLLQAPPKVVVTIEKDLVVVGVDARDRPGLLLDISKGLLTFNLQLHHTEAAVVNGRSLSIWRCEHINADLVDVEQLWTILTALLEADHGILAVKKRGLTVIRARVTPVSRLVGKTAADIDFRQRYKAAIVTMQRGGKNVNEALSTIAFEAGDSLILQASEDSPLLRLKPPTDDFYKKLEEEAKSATPLKKPSSYVALANLVKIPQLGRKGSLEDIPSDGPNVDADAGDIEISQPMQISESAEDELILRDLEVNLGTTKSGSTVQPSREFLTAMAVEKNSQLSGRTAAESGINKLPGVVLISVERPVPINIKSSERRKSFVVSIASHSADEADGALSVMTGEPTYTTIEPDEPLQDGDVLWFAGSANAVGDLRKIPGLISFESEEVKKMNENVHDRRLVQAVIARQGPLVGKTVKEVRFRTRYGAAVIAVHREGKRIHDHPGNIVLQAGDVLLLEAGSTFIGKSAENERSFALLSEVKDSAPPRLRLLVPALVITAIMLIVATLGIASLLVCALVASILMVLMGILSEQEARDAVNWEVFITIASAFGIGTALVNSGLAGAIATGLVAVGEAVGLGDAGLYGAVYLATMIISNVVTNNAAAALVFPIAMTAAEETGADGVLMSYALMLGASASFMTPFGYTTNLMIYGPGGYKSKDFLVVGTPLQFILWVFTTMMLATPDSWWLSWAVTFGAFFLVIMFRVRQKQA